MMIIFIHIQNKMYFYINFNPFFKCYFFQNFDDDQQNMITANTDDLESIQLNHKEEEEMDELVVNENNYDQNFDFEEDKQTFVQ